jgi:hypothetical protein
MYPMPMMPMTPTARGLSTSRESALCTRPASDTTTGSTSRRSAACAGRTAACPRCARRLSPRRPYLCPPHPRAASSPSPTRGPSPRRCVPCAPPHPRQGLPRRSRRRRRARRRNLHPASARQSARSTRRARRAASWTQQSRSRVDADVDTDGDTPKSSSVMLSPLTVEDQDRDQEEEDPPPPGLTMTKRKRKKLGLPHVRRAAAIGRGDGAHGSARSSAGEIVIPGGRFHPATHAATAAGSSSTGGRRGCRYGRGVAEERDGSHGRPQVLRAEDLMRCAAVCPCSSIPALRSTPHVCAQQTI